LRGTRARLTCQQCGQRLDPGDTTIIKIAQPRFQERNHRCPNCSALIAIEIGPNEEVPPFDPNATEPDSA
jgi:hypothetical protein